MAGLYCLRSSIPHFPYAMQKPEETIKQRVALYIRVSTDEQVERYGIPLQKAALQALIKSRPNDLMPAGERYIYIDNGISGTIELDERPAFSQLKEDIVMASEGERPFDIVAVYKIDRFARQLRILLDVIELFDDYGIKFISANESIDTSTPFGKAMLGIIGVIAELERDTIVRRTQDGRMQAFHEGVVLGSNAPFGYIKDERKKYKVMENEAEIVRIIFGLYVDEKRTADQIATYLLEHDILSPVASALQHKKRKGVLSKRNKSAFWTTDAVRRVLSEEIYVGRIYGNKTKKGKHIEKDERTLSKAMAPIIIDPLTFEKAQQILAQSTHVRQRARDGYVYLLTGLLKCDCCFDPKKDAQDGRIGWHGERRLVGKKMQHYYKCARKNPRKASTTCPALPLPANEIEKYLVEYSRKLLKNPIAVFEHQKKLQSGLKRIEHLRKQEASLVELINAIPDKKERLREQHTASVIDTPTLERKFKEFEADEARYRKERAELQMQISQHTLSSGYIRAFELFSGKYKQALEAGFKDRATLYTILHELISEVVIYTRPLNKKEIVAGPRKVGQELPYRIHIKLRLPQDILDDLGGQAAIITDDAPLAPKEGSGQKIASGAG